MFIASHYNPRMAKTSAYYLRGIPRDIWLRFKSKAALEDRSIADVMLALILAWVKE